MDSTAHQKDADQKTEQDSSEVRDDVPRVAGPAGDPTVLDHLAQRRVQCQDGSDEPWAQPGEDADEGRQSEYGDMDDLVRVRHRDVVGA